MNHGRNGRTDYLRVLAPLSPYASCLLGLHLLHSAWAALLLYHAAIALVVFRHGFRPALSEARRGWSAPPGAALSLACLANGGALLLLWRFVARDPEGLSGQLTHLGLSGGSWWFLSAWYVLVHPILEELFWRPDPSFRRGRGVLSDLAFAGYHSIVLIVFLRWYWVLPVVLLLAAAGWSWRRCTRRLGGPAVAIVSHSFAGLGTMIAAAILAGRIHP